MKKFAWSWEGFKEGIKDEGIPLAGATIGAALTKKPGTALRNAALGYAGGGAASLGYHKLKGDKDPDASKSTARRILGASALGYGVGGLAHAGLQSATKKALGGKAKFKGLKGLAQKALHNEHKGIYHGLEEGLPALGATGATGIAMATEKKDKEKKSSIMFSSMRDELVKIAIMTRMQMGGSGSLSPQGAPVDVGAIPGNKFSSPEWQAHINPKPVAPKPMAAKPATTMPWQSAAPAIRKGPSIAMSAPRPMGRAGMAASGAVKTIGKAIAKA